MSTLVAVPSQTHRVVHLFLTSRRGNFINENISYPAGTEFNVKPMTAHGPHTTKNGCSVLITFSYPSALDDFTLA
jgi:hypothetical protein